MREKKRLRFFIPPPPPPPRSVPAAECTARYFHLGLGREGATVAIVRFNNELLLPLALPHFVPFFFYFSFSLCTYHGAHVYITIIIIPPQIYRTLVRRKNTVNTYTLLF